MNNNKVTGKMYKLVMVAVLVLSQGCAFSQDENVDRLDSGSLTSDQWDPCGVNVQCSSGLSCYGVCTFECGEKYKFMADGTYEYGLDRESVDRCDAIGGRCEMLSGVQINVCTK
jgi:hypothetical protein